MHYKVVSNSVEEYFKWVVHSINESCCNIAEFTQLLCKIMTDNAGAVLTYYRNNMQCTKLLASEERFGD